MGCDSSKDLKVVPNHSSKDAENGLDADPEEGEQKDFLKLNQNNHDFIVKQLNLSFYIKNVNLGRFALNI